MEEGRKRKKKWKENGKEEDKEGEMVYLTNEILSLNI